MAGDWPPGAPRLVRGSVVTYRRPCGKASCRCADGEQLHESMVLSYSEGRPDPVPDAARCRRHSGAGRHRPLSGSAGQGRGGWRGRQGRADQPAQAVNGSTTPRTSSNGTSDGTDAFAVSRELFETLRGFLDGAATADLSHGDQSPGRPADRDQPQPDQDPTQRRRRLPELPHQPGRAPELPEGPGQRLADRDRRHRRRLLAPRERPVWTSPEPARDSPEPKPS